MKQGLFEIIENKEIAAGVKKLVLKGDVSAVTAPGQFINIKLEGFYLRRPISVFDLGKDSVAVIYKVVGGGTEYLAGLSGGILDVLTGLGNGYDLTSSGDSPLLIGGGAGVPPMYYLAKKLICSGKRVTAVLGFNTKSEIFCKKDFEDLGVQTIITTADGSCGVKGFVTDAIKGLDYSYFYACGPQGMLKAVCDATVTSGQLSFEERMGCGFGACMGCSCKTLYGSKRICRDGPVLKKEEIIWGD